VTTSFQITLSFLDELTETQEAAFVDAAAPWSAVITNDLQDADFPLELIDPDDPNEICAPAAGTGTIPIDDLLLFVLIAPDDGPGGTLASAGACFFRSSDDSPAVGIMNFDTADVDTLEGQGLFRDVVLHEMGHVIGVGAALIWPSLIENPSFPSSPGVETVFSGPLAAAAFTDLGGTCFPNRVPVDNTAVGGSADSHWREGIFTIELMSPSITGLEPSLPLSSVTVASLVDLGIYTTNGAAADAFSLSAGLRSERPVPEFGHCSSRAVTEVVPVPGGFRKAR
jgi:hypothetical protein